ncbi:MAG TPA: dipeptidase [Bryobacteraceae bacterium]|nr:dipeptidase [Bryobacteraceae bacterium]
MKPALLVVLAGIPLLGFAVSERARKLHEAAFVFDAHVHMVDRQMYLGGDIGERVSNGQVDLPRARDGGIDAMFFSIFIPEDYYPQRFETKQALRLVDLALTQIEHNRNVIELARNASDIVRINRAGKMAAVLDIEGGFDLDGDLGVLRSLYRLGVRSLQLPAHNWTNNFADSCCAAPKNGGLNERGKAVVREMNRLGMVINVSHAADATIAAALDVSTAPLIATHHGIRTLNNIPRNMPEDLMRRIAAKGGVIGFQIGNEFHNRKAFDWRTQHAGKPFWDTSEIGKRKETATIEEIDRKVAPRFPMVGVNMPESILFTPDEWIAVIEKAIAIAGEDHVALGSDFDGGPTPPKGIRDISGLPLLTDAMLRRGWPEERIRKFLGGNLLRVFRQITEGK